MQIQNNAQQTVTVPVNVEVQLVQVEKALNSLIAAIVSGMSAQLFIKVRSMAGGMLAHAGRLGCLL